MGPSSHLPRAPLLGSPVASNGNINGHANGHASGSSSRLVAEVQPVRLDGQFMYADEADWTPSDHHGAFNDDETVVPDQNNVSTSNRMPVDREEVVRLILQGLRDVGYT